MAEKNIIKPDINPCDLTGRVLNITELMAGYMGAINRPINGNTKAASGALPQPVIA